jgi:hypothetical protein
MQVLKSCQEGQANWQSLSLTFNDILQMFPGTRHARSPASPVRDLQSTARALVLQEDTRPRDVIVDAADVQGSHASLVALGLLGVVVQQQLHHVVVSPRHRVVQREGGGGRSHAVRISACLQQLPRCLRIHKLNTQS